MYPLRANVQRQICIGTNNNGIRETVAEPSKVKPSDVSRIATYYLLYLYRYILIYKIYTIYIYIPNCLYTYPK